MKSQSKKVVTKSEQETKEFAARFAAQILQKKGNKNAVVLALQGDLGAGKTTFTQGFAQGLGIQEKINSPTFIIMKRFTIYDLRFKNFYHIDCYRLENGENDLEALGFKEILADPKNIVAIEWPERITKILPKKVISVTFDHGAENTRTLTIKR